MPDISLRAYAKRRGISLRAVQKAIADGRIHAETVSRNPTGRITGINADRADREWVENTDPGEAAKNGHILSAPETHEQLELPAAATSPSDEEPKDPEGFHAHRARRERFAADKAELDHLERLGVLGSIADFRGAVLELGGFFKDELMGVSARISAQLAAEPDPVKIDALLSAEHRRVLNVVADKCQRLATAEGAGERETGDTSIVC